MLNRDKSEFTGHGQRPRIAIIFAALAIGFLVQFALVSYAFPLSELLSNKPLLEVDHPFHLYMATVAREMFSSTTVIGYDPFFGAGTISGILADLSSKIPALLSAVSAHVTSPAIIYKLYVFTASILSPLFVGLSAAILRVGVVGTATATLLAIIYWWASYLHWYHTAGMVGYVTGAYLAVFFVSMVIHVLNHATSKASIVIAGIIGAIALLAHPLTPIIIGALLSSHLSFNFTRLFTPHSAKIIFVVALFCLLPNYFWMIDALQSLNAAGNVPHPYQKAVDALAVITEAAGVFGGNSYGTKLNPFLILASLIAIYSARGRSASQYVLPFFVAAILLSLMSHLGGGNSTIAKLQPNRLSPVAYFLLIIPASAGVAVIYNKLQSGRQPIIYWLLAVIMLLGVFMGGYEMLREVSNGEHGRYGQHPPMVKGPGPVTRATIHAINTHTSQNGRILFENSVGRVYDNGNIAGYLALTTQRYFIGGPYQFFTNHTATWDGHLFSRPVNTISVSEMTNLLNAYNIGWALLHSDDCKKYFDNYPLADRIFEHYPIALYRINRPLSYILRGSGKLIAADYSGVYINGTPGSNAVLSFKYSPHLRSNTNAIIEKFWMEGVNEPFIHIRNYPGKIHLHWEKNGNPE